MITDISTSDKFSLSVNFHWMLIFNNAEILPSDKYLLSVNF